MRCRNLADNNLIVETARSWLGTPFKHQGRVKGLGVDCVGLIIGIAHEIGYSNYDFTNYGRQPHGGTLVKIMGDHLDLIPIEDAVEGDIYVMRWENEPQHMGIKTDKGIIHSYESIGKCVEHGLDSKWHKRIVAAYRYRDI